MPDRVNRHHRTGFTKTIFIKTVLLVRVNVVSNASFGRFMTCDRMEEIRLSHTKKKLKQ